MEPLNNCNIDSYMAEQQNWNMFEGCETEADVFDIVYGQFITDDEFMSRLEDLDETDVYSAALSASGVESYEDIEVSGEFEKYVECAEWSEELGGESFESNMLNVFPISEPTIKAIVTYWDQEYNPDKDGLHGDGENELFNGIIKRVLLATYLWNYEEYHSIPHTRTY